MDTTMNRSTKPVSSTPTARTSILSRLLASENLRIVHDANMKSAAFDLAARTLILPMWKCEKVVYDMLVGHEVAHAKYTPAVRWKSAAEEIGGKKFARVAQDYINVIEDARIERMIKREFPGLRADFIAGYKHMHEVMDIFQIAKRDIATMSFIDRINLHYKIGVHCGVTIPFTDAERPILDRINATREGARGFEDVVAIARDLFTMKQEQDENNDDAEGDANGEGEQQDENTEKSNKGKGQKPDACKGEESEDESTDGSSGDDQDGSEDQSDGSSTDGDEEQDGNGSSEGGNGEAEGNGTTESAEDDTDDGESAESRKAEPSKSGKSSKVNINNGEFAPAEVSTSDAMSNGIEKFVDSNYSEEIITIGRIDPSKVVVSVKDFMALCDSEFHTGYYGNTKPVDAATIDAAALKAFKRVTDANKRNVELMVKRFEVKRAARNHARTSSCKSGRISTRQLAKYKFSEDIFDRLTIKQDEKNHGLVILLDWSGSIGYMIGETVSQLTALLHFCRRAGIPAEVYFFTTQYCPAMDQAFLDRNPQMKNDKNWKQILSDTRRWNSSNIPGIKWNMNEESHAFSDHAFGLPAGTTAKGGSAVLQPFSLIKVYEQNMNAKSFARAIGRLILLAGTQGGGCIEVNEYGLGVNGNMQLGGTPLDESILAMREIVKDFRKSSNTKVTLVNLTDGDGMSVTGRTEMKNKKATTHIVMDEETGRRFDNYKFGHAEVMQMFKDATDVQAVGIFITRCHGSQSCNIGVYGRALSERFIQKGKWQISDEGKKVLENDEKQWREQKFVAFPYAPYDMYFMVNIPDRAQAKRQAEMEDAKVERMKNKKVAATRAFIAAMRAEESNRMFINRLMDVIA